MIDIVIVNWNSGLQLQECVESVLEYGSDQYAQIIIVDNGSTDGSADRIDGLSGVKVIFAHDNLGFAAACNMGAAEGNSPYILFLNPDTKIQKDSLTIPLSFMEKTENAGVGVCGAQLFDEENKISLSCSRFPSLRRFIAVALGLDKFPGFRGLGMAMQDWDHKSSRRVDQVIGAFYFIRRGVFESLGGFDSRFFVYFEEVDLSLRAKQLGWDSWFLADAQVFHAGNGCSQQIKARRLFYSLRSRLLYGFKNFKALKAWLLLSITCTVEPITRTVWCLISCDWTGVRNTWKAYGMLMKDMIKIIQKSNGAK